MVLDRLAGQHQPLGDLVVGEPERDQFGNLRLALGQARGIRCRRLTRTARDRGAQLTQAPGGVRQDRMCAKVPQDAVRVANGGWVLALEKGEGGFEGVVALAPIGRRTAPVAR